MRKELSQFKHERSYAERREKPREQQGIGRRRRRQNEAEESDESEDEAAGGRRENDVSGKTARRHEGRCDNSPFVLCLGSCVDDLRCKSRICWRDASSSSRCRSRRRACRSAGEISFTKASPFYPLLCCCQAPARRFATSSLCVRPAALVRSPPQSVSRQPPLATPRAARPQPASAQSAVLGPRPAPADVAARSTARGAGRPRVPA